MIHSLFTVREAAEKLSVSESMVYKLIHEGRLSHHKIGRAVRISPEQILRYLRESERENQPEEEEPQDIASREVDEILQL